MKRARVTIGLFLLLTALSLAISRPAHAANDALCGTTIVEDLVLTEDLDCTGYTGVAITIGAPNVTISGNGFKLHAPDSSVAISATSQDGVTIQDLAVEGWCTGTGIAISGGTGHVIDNVVASGRSYGLDIANAVDVIISDFTADASANSGLKLNGVTGTVTLERLTLTNGTIGLELLNMAGPRTIDAAAISSVAGSDTGILLSNVDDYTFSGLTTLDGATYGINAGALTNSGLTFTGVNLSGANGIGTGLSLGGAGHTLTNVTASRRKDGVLVSGVAGLSITTLTANGDTNAALSLTAITAPLTLSGLTLTDSAIGLGINGFDAPANWTLDETVILSVAKSDVAVSLTNVQNAVIEDLTLPGVTYGISAASTTNDNLTLRRLDLSAPYPWGTGLVLSGTNHTVEDVTVDRREFGVVTTASNLSLKTIKATNTYGRAVEIDTYVPTVLEDLRIDRALVGLYLGGVQGSAGDELTLDPFVSGVGGVFTTLSRCGTSIELVSSAYIALDHLVLDGHSFGLDADNAANQHITLNYVDASGHENGVGTGVYLNGPGHALTHVTARGRSYGVRVDHGSGAALSDVDASGNGYGLILAAFATTDANPTFSTVNLSDNTYGLWLYSIQRTAAQAFKIDLADGFDFSRSETGILAEYNSEITFLDLRLNGETYGFNATHTNANLTFDGVDASGQGRGDGIRLGVSNHATASANWAGSGHRLIDVTANRRAYGVRAYRANDLGLTRLTATGCTTGLYLDGVEAAATSATDPVVVDEVPPTFATLTLTDNASYGLQLLNWRVPAVIDGVAQGLDVSGSGYGIVAAGMTSTTFQHLSLSNRVAGFYGYGNTDLLLDDVDASGPGVGVGVQLGSTAYGDVYQRAGDGCVVHNVTADRRAVGVDVYGGAGTVLDDVKARNGTIGVQLMGQPANANPTLEKLDLGGNATGLSLKRMPAETPPWTVGVYDPAADSGLGAGAIADTALAGAPTSGLAGTDVGVAIGYSDGVVVDGLILDGAVHGVDASNTANANLVFKNLDVSGTRRVGDGLYLAGPGHRVENVTADRRAYGMQTSGVSDLTIAGFTADGCATGLYLYSTTLPLSLTNLTLTNASGSALYIRGLSGTSTDLFDLGPYAYNATTETYAGAITSLAGSATGIQLEATSYLRVHDLTLDNRAVGINAYYTLSANTNLTFEDLTLHGPGHGVGLSLRGADHTVSGVTADHWGTGVYLYGGSGASLSAVTVHDAAKGVEVAAHNGALSLSGLDLRRCGAALTFSGTVTPAVTVDAAALGAQAGNDVVVSAVATVTVDGAALGLTASGNTWRDTTPAANDPDCGAVLTSGYVPLGTALTKSGSAFTLAADLACPSVTAVALTLGETGVTLEGGGHKIVAPHASTVVNVNGIDNSIVNNVDVSGSYAKTGAAGVRLTNGAANTVSNVIASYRERGIIVTGTTDLVVSGLTTVGCDYAGLDLVDIAAGTRALSVTDVDLTGGRRHGLRLSNVDGADPTDLTGATPLLLDAAALTDLRGNGYSLAFESGSQKITVDGLGVPPLDGWSHGVYALTATNAELTFENLDLSGVGGRGIELNGAGHTLTTVTVDDRIDAVWVSGGSGLTVRDLQVDGAGHPTSGQSGHGLYLTGLSDAPTLKNLSLQNADTALRIETVDWTAAPLTLDPYVAAPTDAGALASVSGSATGLYLSAVKGLKVAGPSAVARLVLDNLTAISAAQGVNADLTFEHLNLSGPRSGGSGLLVGATGLTITDVIADDRATGVQVGGTDVAVTGVHADRATLYGLLLSSLSHVDAASTWSVTDVTARDAVEGIRFSAVTGNDHIVGPYAAGAGMVTDLSGSVTAVNVFNASDLVFDHLVLTNPVGITANNAGNARLTFQDLSLNTPARVGHGLYLTGTDHTVQRVTIQGHDNGLYTGAVSGLVVDDLSVADAVTHGVAITSTTDVPNLKKLSLTNCTTGLYLAGFTGTSTTPLILNPWDGTAGVIASLADSQTGIYLNGAKYVTVKDFTGLEALSNSLYGLRADASANANLSVTNIDVSGGRSGYGLWIKGGDHTLTTITAKQRGFGVIAEATKGLSISGLTAADNTIGLDLRGNTTAAVAGVPTYDTPTLSGIQVSNNRTGLQVYQWSLPWVIDNASGWFSATGSWDGVRMNGVSDVTLRNFVGANRLANPGNGVIAKDGTNARLTFEHLDVSGGGVVYHASLDVSNGLRLQGTDCVIDDVVASGRRIGLYASASSNLTLTSLRAEKCTVGALLGTFAATATAPTLSTLHLGDNAYGLYFYNGYQTPTTVNATTAFDVSGSRYGVYVDAGLNKDITLDGLTLGNPYGVYANGASGMAVTNANVSGSGRGRGIDFRGSGLTIDNVDANDREYGVYIANSGANSGSHSITALHSARASSAALYLSQGGGAVGGTNLSGLELTDSSVGLQLASTAGPLTLNAAALADLSGNRTGVYLDQYVSDVTLSGLTLDGPVTGATSASSRGARNAFVDLDVTGSCRGVGLNLTGDDVTVDGVTAARRATGINFDTGDKIAITDTVIGANTTGLSVGTTTRLLDTVVVAHGDNSPTALRVAVHSNTYNAAVGDVVAVTPPGGETFYPTITGLSNYTIFITPAMAAAAAVGTLVQESDAFAPGARVTMTGTDVCANGTGAALGTQTTVATSDYWRSLNGPTHASVSGGDGDTVTATGSVDLSGFLTVPADKLDPYCNQAPVADAGTAQSVCEGDTVTLDASASSDPDIEPLTYLWSQAAGTTATLTGADTAQPTFTAPHPASAPEVLTFELMAADDQLQRADQVEVTVALGNPLPTAAAGDDQSVDEGAAVALDGSSSFDPEGTALSYAWVQTAGPSVALTGATTATPSFTAPAVGPGGDPALATTITLTLTVTDVEPAGYCGGPKSVVDAVTVTVNNVDTAPSAAAGNDQAVLEGTTVTLSAAGSSDPDGDTLSYGWTQTGGTTVTLTGATTAAPSFTAPAQAQLATEVLTFSLTVSDGFGGVATDTVLVTVNDACVGADADSDGTPDCLDLCPADPQKVIPGICGCGELDTDSDLDGTPDCAEDCGGEADGTVVASGISCGTGACGAILGDITCEGGAAVRSCDPAYQAVPDTSCDTVGLVVTYAVAFDAGGAPRGTIRCTRTPAGVVGCDEDTPGVLHVYDALYCPGVTP